MGILLHMSVWGNGMATTGTKKWWKNAVVYQIYPHSFCDSNGDGIGDLPGITSKLNYLKNLGVDIIMLGPIFPSPCLDKGYDISDFKGINPELGTMEDMERLISRAKKNGIKIILDISINSTSDEHQWFKKALAGDEKYKDYYYFAKGNNSKNPNNWRSLCGGSAWTKTGNGDFYLHILGEHQPDLNWENPAVYNEIVDVMKFWMDKGIAGFRLDTANAICKDSLSNGKFSFSYRGKEHYLHTEGSHDILRRLKEDVWANYKGFIVGETVLASQEEAKLLCDEGRNELDAVFYFGRMDVDRLHCRRLIRKRNVRKLIRFVDKGQSSLNFPVNYIEVGPTACYSKYFGDDKVNCHSFEKMLTGLNFSLRGIPFISEGLSPEFTGSPDDPTSLYTFCSRMVDFRKNSKALSDGKYRRVGSQNDVYIFTREAIEERVYVYCNFSNNSSPVEFYGDRIVFSNYSIDSLRYDVLKPYEFRIVASNI